MGGGQIDLFLNLLSLKKSPTVLSLGDFFSNWDYVLIWLLNGDAGNGLNVANDVNVNIIDANDVNGGSNANTISDEKKLLINEFWNIQYWTNVKLIRNIFYVSL